MLLRCGSHTLDLSTPVVMGIVNVTPDSFSDGGRYFDSGAAVEYAQRMVDAGARIIDVGGESTRPGASDVAEDEEIRRVVPVVAALAKRLDVPISVDTSKTGVMCASLEAGAAMINDVRALTDPGAINVVAATSAGVCLMHMQGEPRSMQHDPRYDDVVGEVTGFLQERIRACTAAGIRSERIAIDPGIGFGKRLEHNLALLSHLPELAQLNRPILIGVSRKSMFASLLNRGVDERVAGGVAVATAAVLAGAHIIRAHDVAETFDAVRVGAALKTAGYETGSRS